MNTRVGDDEQSWLWTFDLLYGPLLGEPGGFPDGAVEHLPCTSSKMPQQQARPMISNAFRKSDSVEYPSSPITFLTWHTIRSHSASEEVNCATRLPRGIYSLTL
jgi:hypothetical protein